MAIDFCGTGKEEKAIKEPYGLAFALKVASHDRGKEGKSRRDRTLYILFKVSSQRWGGVCAAGLPLFDHPPPEQIENSPAKKKEREKEKKRNLEEAHRFRICLFESLSSSTVGTDIGSGLCADVQNSFKQAPVEYSTGGRSCSLRLERAMVCAPDAPQLACLMRVELVGSSLAVLDENTLSRSSTLPTAPHFPRQQPRPRAVALNACLQRDALAYDLHFHSPPHPGLTAPSMDLMQALSRFFGTALTSASALGYIMISIADVRSDALVIFLSVLRSLKRIAGASMTNLWLSM
ncbi:hypothetical protein B0H19DRAFT_1290845 [Mycena capillaripes]|nr:hypothetical protein B0H19DRAFT_1290845 [Mycena capillaripes]